MRRSQDGIRVLFKITYNGMDGSKNREEDVSNAVFILSLSRPRFPSIQHSEFRLSIAFRIRFHSVFNVGGRGVARRFPHREPSQARFYTIYIEGLSSECDRRKGRDGMTDVGNLNRKHG